MFGRRKNDDARKAPERDDEEELALDEDAREREDSDDDAPEAGELDDIDGDDADGDDAEAVPDEWDELDASADWRDDGPFDLSEVDLDLDEEDVTRLDFGSLILTPFDGMQLQLQVDQATSAVQTALVMKGNSGLEVALFAAPRSGGLAKAVRDDMVSQAVQAGGQGELAAGPFGTEVRRIIPMQTPDGQQAAHVSRTWLAEGPRWLLRGVLMGEVCLGATEGGDEEFVEFFKNIVVRRGTTAMPQGDLIAMTLPEEMRPEAQA